MDPKAVNLQREYSINQVEYCRNFIFKRNFPIHKIFERSCEMGLFRLSADKVAHIFGVRLTKRLRGKLYSVLEKLDHGHHVMRTYCKNLVGRMYEKFSTFLRVGVCVNRMKDLGLNKGLKNPECLRQKLVDITDRFTGFEFSLGRSICSITNTYTGPFFATSRSPRCSRSAVTIDSPAEGYSWHLEWPSIPNPLGPTAV